MAGRGGRGRGRGKNISFNIESLGFGRGEALPTPILQPPPLYPLAQFKPVPLVVSEEEDYLVAVKQDLRTAMQDSPYYIMAQQKKCDIERYSDKYHVSKHDKWQPDWKRLPLELQPKRKRVVKPAPVIKKQQPVNLTEQFKALEHIQGDEEPEEEEEEEEKKAEDEEELEEYDESDLEEETDYNLTYFDNGENDDEDDDLDEGPVY